MGKELINKHYYTLDEAADELNAYFGKTNVTADWFIQYAGLGYIYLHFLVSIDARSFTFVPDMYFEYNENPKIMSNYDYLDVLHMIVTVPDEPVMLLELSYYDMGEFEIKESLELSDVFITNIYSIRQRKAAIPDNLRKIFSSVSLYNMHYDDLYEMVDYIKETDEVHPVIFKGNGVTRVAREPDKNYIISFDINYRKLNKLDSGLKKSINFRKSDLRILDTELERLKKSDLRDLISEDNRHDTGTKNEIKPTGTSPQKRAAKVAAKTLAIYLWQQDADNRIKIKEMALSVYAALNQTEHESQLPDQPESLKEWIKDVAPEYARQAGATPSN